MAIAPYNPSRGWLGVALALGVPVVAVVALPVAGNSDISLGREVFWWGLGAVVLYWALRIEHFTPASLALRRPRPASLGWGLAGGLLMIVTLGLCYAVLFPALGIRSSPSQLAAIAAQPMGVVALLSLRAAVVEEWLFRFYAIGRLQALGSGPALAMLAPGAVFIVLHAGGWGALHLVPVTLVTVVITALYAWRRDYACSVIAHFLADFIPFAAAALQARS